MRRLSLLIFLSAWLALPVAAQTSINGFSNCGPLGSARAETNANVSEGRILCFDFDSGFGTNTSGRFRVVASAAKLCLEPDRGGTSGAAVVDVQWCNVDSASDNACNDTGLTLSASNFCEAVVRGNYRYEVTTAPAGTEDAQITAEGY